MSRKYSALDELCMQVDLGLRTLANNYPHQHRPNPDQNTPDIELSQEEQKHAAGLMRVNHAGEVAAQGLYQGQSLTARLGKTRTQMEQAAEEEIDHLHWCYQRLIELKSHTSYLNPIWYLGSLIIGATAGAIGDKWSLGFVAETEQQVCQHLKNHLGNLPEADKKSRAIVNQMHEDEAKHQETAKTAGAANLPSPIKQAMKLTSKLMTKTAYWI